MSEPENPYDKAARLVVRLIASGLVLIGVLDMALEFLAHRVQGNELHLGSIIINSLVFLVGVVLFVLTGRLAAWLADYFDE